MFQVAAYEHLYLIQSYKMFVLCTEYVSVFNGISEKQNTATARNLCLLFEF
jgi:hypothetical protein